MRLCSVLALVLVAGTATAAPPKRPATKPAPAPVVVAAPAALAIVETVDHPKSDYQAEVYSGVPLEDRYARERGVDKGLVLMVFDKQRRAAFRVPHEKIRKRVRLAATAPASAPVVVASFVPSAATSARDHVDVLDTVDGIVVVDTTTTSAGIFTTSDVYVFPKGASGERRTAMLAPVPPLPRERVRQALATLR